MDTIPEAFNLYFSTPAFHTVELSLIRTMAEYSTLRSYEARQVIYIDGEPCEGLYIIQNGWVKGYVQGSCGREQEMWMLGPGGVFNGVGLIGKKQNLETAQAITASRVFIMQQSEIIKLLEIHPKLNSLILEHLAAQVYHLVDLVESLSLCTVESRLARFLLSKEVAGTVLLKPLITQAELANQLGSVPGVISRALHHFSDEGLIKIEPRRVVILDGPGLERKAA